MEPLQKEIILILGELSPTSYGLYRCAEKIDAHTVCLLVKSNSVVTHKSYSGAMIEWCSNYDDLNHIKKPESEE